jgi:hypothetical protein
MFNTQFLALRSATECHIYRVKTLEVFYTSIMLGTVSGMYFDIHDVSVVTFIPAFKFGHFPV